METPSEQAAEKEKLPHYFLRELSYFVSTIAKFVALCIGAGSVLFVFGVRFVEWGSVTFPIFDAREPSIVNALFTRTVSDLVPTGVALVASGPYSAFAAELFFSSALGGLVALPLFLYWLFGYLSPVLTIRERQKIVFVVLPIVLLFILGILFGYRIVAPRTYAALFGHASALSVPAYFFIDDFFSTTLLILAVSGLLFVLPGLLPLSTYFLGVPSTFWKDSWRLAFFTTLVCAGLATKDGTGVSMMLLSIPLLILYWIGYAISLWIECLRGRW